MVLSKEQRCKLIEIHTLNMKLYSLLCTVYGFGFLLCIPIHWSVETQSSHTAIGQWQYFDVCTREYIYIQTQICFCWKWNKLWWYLETWVGKSGTCRLLQSFLEVCEVNLQSRCRAGVPLVSSENRFPRSSVFLLCLRLTDVGRNHLPNFSLF